MNSKIRKKTLHRHVINQVTQCESEPPEVESTIVITTLYSEAQAITLPRYKFAGKITEKIDVLIFQTETKKRLYHDSHYQESFEILFHLDPEDRKNELKRLKIITNQRN